MRNLQMDDYDDDDVVSSDIDFVVNTWLRDACYVCHEITRVKVVLTRSGHSACICTNCLNDDESDLDTDDKYDPDIDDDESY